MIRKWKADIVCLQETKMELINRGVICSLWGGQHVDWLYSGFVGRWGVIDVGQQGCGVVGGLGGLILSLL